MRAPDLMQAPVVPMSTAHAGEIEAYPMRMASVDARDIAAALSKLCRFTGHTRRFYSVAEHSLRVCAHAERCGEPPEVVHLALLHDAHEAYIGDLSTMWKRVLPQFEAFEGSVQRSVLVGLGVPRLWRNDPKVWRAVKHFDTVALHTEAWHLFKPAPSWVDSTLALLDDTLPECLEPEAAEKRFLGKLAELGYAEVSHVC